MDDPAAVAAIIGAIAALVGASVGAVGAYLTQSTQWKREQSRRWDEHRSKVYADYVAACDELALNTTMARHKHTPGGAPTPPELLVLLSTKVWPLRGQVELLGGRTVNMWAGRLHDRVEVGARDPYRPDEGGYRSARAETIEVMRRELGVSDDPQESQH